MSILGLPPPGTVAITDPWVRARLAILFAKARMGWRETSVDDILPVLNPPGRLLKQVGFGKGGIDRAEALEGKFAVDSDSNHRSRVRKKWSMPSSSDQTRVGRTLTLGGGAESPLEGRHRTLGLAEGHPYFAP
jgi:hypothetical protein